MEKIISETAPMPEVYNENAVIIFTEIQKHLDEGWLIKSIFHLPVFINSVGPAHLNLTVHLQKL
jgi:hypothetical protein